MESDRFDGLVRTVAERGEEHARARAQFAALTRLVAAPRSRRLVLVGLLAMVLPGVGAGPTAAQCRSKEGKNKRRCRRREREGKAPGAGGLIPCQKNLFGLCTLAPIGDECCDKAMVCTDTIGSAGAGLFGVRVTACQVVCQTDNDCERHFPNRHLACRTDVLVCPIEAVKGQKCCVPR